QHIRGRAIRRVCVQTAFFAAMSLWTQARRKDANLCKLRLVRTEQTVTRRRMSPEEAEFVDRLGLFFEVLGATRTMGRLYGWLLICDPPQQSLTKLAEALSVSKASISTVARQLQEGGMVERLPSPSRQHLYRVTPGGFTSVLETQLSLMRRGIEPAEFALSV